MRKPRPSSSGRRAGRQLGQLGGDTKGAMEVRKEKTRKGARGKFISHWMELLKELRV